ncbi:MAG TPA: hypothetical protein VIK01_08485, partial [Polyangiaceae bacterium]
LAVPSSSRLLVAEPSFSVTLDDSARTERGVTTSVASVPSDPHAPAKRRTKSTVLVLGLTSVAVLGLMLGRGLGNDTKRTAYPEPKSIVVLAGAPLPVKDEAPALAALPATSDAAMLLPSAESAPKAAHSAAVRPVNRAGSQASVAKKPAAAKLTVDPFLKRH